MTILIVSPQLRRVISDAGFKVCDIVDKRPILDFHFAISSMVYVALSYLWPRARLFDSFNTELKMYVLSNSVPIYRSNIAIFQPPNNGHETQQTSSISLKCHQTRSNTTKMKNVNIIFITKPVLLILMTKENNFLEIGN